MTLMRRVWIASGFVGLIAVAAVVVLLACSEDEDLPVATIGATPTKVRVLNTREQRADAMITYGEAEPYVPIILAYPRERIFHLHTERIKRGFDVVFISKAGAVVEFQTLPRASAEGITSARTAAYALMLPEGGWAASGAAVGGQVTLPPITSQDLPMVGFAGKDLKLPVELALTDEERRRGLMHRPRLGENEGMIFKYPGKSDQGFWMKNTKIPLSIAFFNDDGVIVNIHAVMTPGQEEPKFESKKPVQYALEVKAGWFEDHGIKEGDTIVLPPEIIDARAGF
jgi:uncharacterized membrane protein (UPF0127 family)